MSTQAETMDGATLAEELRHLLAVEISGRALAGTEDRYHGWLDPFCAGRAAALQAAADERSAELAGLAGIHGALLPLARLAGLPEADRTRALAGNVLRLRCHAELACEVMS